MIYAVLPNAVVVSHHVRWVAFTTFVPTLTHIYTGIPLKHEVTFIRPHLIPTTYIATFPRFHQLKATSSRPRLALGPSGHGEMLSITRETEAANETTGAPVALETTSYKERK